MDMATGAFSMAEKLGKYFGFTFTLHGEGRYRCVLKNGRGSENKSCLWRHHS